jgi:hypothetical protein
MYVGSNIPQHFVQIGILVMPTLNIVGVDIKHLQKQRYLID